MRRKKSTLSLHRPKQKRTGRNTTERGMQNDLSRETKKRKTFFSPARLFSPAKCQTQVILQGMTPVLSPMKSPFRSPLYKVSPPKKRARKGTSARALFEKAGRSSSLEHLKRCLPDLDCIQLNFDSVFESDVACLVNDEDSQCVSNNQKSSVKLNEFEISESAFENSDSSPHDINVIDNAESVSNITGQTQNSPEKLSSPSSKVEIDNPKIASTSTGANISVVADKIQKLTPEVIELLASRDGLDHVLLQFFEQVRDKRFPLDNMSFRLWTEVVKWFQCSTSTEMRYSEVTKQFWRLGYKLFGARFTNFMGGYKHHGQVINNETVKGYFPPASASINFAVPNDKILRQFVMYDTCGERPPGLFVDVLERFSKSLEGKSCCLTFDGKKLKQGLTENAGDVDLLGFEQGTTLNERKMILQFGLQTIENMRKCLADSHDLLINNSQQIQANLRNFLLGSLQTITRSIIDIRKIRSRKEYAKGKLIERGGESDWRKGRYAFAVSAIIAFLFDIDTFLNEAVRISDEINKCIASLNGQVYSTENVVDVRTHTKYVSINDQCGTSGDTRLIPQRTEQWAECRRLARVTGSTLHSALGFDGLGKQRNHFDRVICQIADNEPSSQAKSNMEHGTLNEINAVSTLLGRILPVLEPTLFLCEEGYVKVQFDEHTGFFVVSPDGSLRIDKTLTSTRVAIEIKCPVTKIHEEFPSRYYLQCVSEIEVLNAEYLLFVSWTKTETLVYKLNRDGDIFKKAMKLALSLYGNNKPKRPTKLSDEQKSLKQEITEASKKVHILGRFASCKAGTVSVAEPETHSLSREHVDNLLGDMYQLEKALYELKREKASEAVVFLVADLDRSWESDKIRAGPVAWFPKGYSLTVETMKRIAEFVHTECHRNAIHVPCVSFDGQWHNIVTRTTANKPLTVHQLQKDVWKAVEKLSKKQILSKIREKNKHPRWNTETISDGDTMRPRKVLVVTNFGKRLPKLPKNLPKPVTDNNDETEVTGETITLADVMPDPVQNTCDLNSNVLSMTAVEENLEIEAYAGNVNETEWALELSDEQKESCDFEQTANTEEDNHQTENCGTLQLPLSDTTNQTYTEKPLPKLLEMKDFGCILSLLRTTENCNKTGKWDNTLADKFGQYFESRQSLASLLHSVKILKGLKESVTKAVKIREISYVLNVPEELPRVMTKNKKSKTYQPMFLSEIATKVIAKLKKEHLNVIQAEYEWPDAYAEWQMAMADIKIDGMEYEWFYHPEFSVERQQFEVRCIDSIHLLTRARRKSCYGGLDGFSNEAWLRVAKSKKKLLTRIMITDVTDPMSAAMAKTHFSLQVETEMRKNGDTGCADLCHDIRCWWEAEDKPGINAQERIQFRNHLRNRLLSRKNFCEFPPATNYARGWPIQLWEGIIASIDAKCLLYAMTKSGTYNQRAFSSMIGETFFSEVSLHDKRGQGTLTATEFGMHIGNTIEQIQTRLDPDRSFSYCSSKKAVYEMVDKADKEYEDSVNNQSNCGKTIPSNIITKNHHFDTAMRARISGSKKVGTISTERNSLQKGALGVRWEKARCNQAKLLPTSKMGID